MIITRNRRLIQSEAYREYEKRCEWYLDKLKDLHINEPVNVCVLYYLPKNKDGSIPKRRVDLCNLLGATCDILVKYGVLEDDNCCIVRSHNGSSVYFVDSGTNFIGAEIIIGSAEPV